MKKWRLTKEQKNLLKFDDCENCMCIFKKICQECDAGEYFQPIEDIEDVVESMDKWEYK